MNKIKIFLSDIRTSSKTHCTSHELRQSLVRLYSHMKWNGMPFKQFQPFLYSNTHFLKTIVVHTYTLRMKADNDGNHLVGFGNQKFIPGCSVFMSSHAKAVIGEWSVKQLVFALWRSATFWLVVFGRGKQVTSYSQKVCENWVKEY